MDDKQVIRLGLSPHLGNIGIGALRTHVYNFAFAAKQCLENSDRSDHVLLRVDDTNVELSNAENIPVIFDTLFELFGIDSRKCKILRQSERTNDYTTQIRKLESDGLVDGGVFNTEVFRDRYGNNITFEDVVLGVRQLNVGAIDPFNLIRSNGSPLYHIASVLEDGYSGVTMVVRGLDKIGTVGHQEMIRIALGLPAKKYAHLPMLRTPSDVPEGYKGNMSYKKLLQLGFCKKAVVSYILSSGYGDPDQFYLDYVDFYRKFSSARIHKHDSLLDIERLRHINTKVLYSMTKEEYILGCIEYLGFNELHEDIPNILGDEAFQELIFKIKKPFRDVPSYIKMIYDYKLCTNDLSDEHKKVLYYIINHNPNLDIELLLKKYNDSAISKKAIYESIRLMILGIKQGPDVKHLIEYYLSRNIVASRCAFIKNLLTTI